jgi:alkylation response protein AidB-like acyl-CoA dehydrogenase
MSNILEGFGSSVGETVGESVGALRAEVARFTAAEVEPPATKVDERNEFPADLFAAGKATWMALEAIQCLGGNGYVNEFSTGRLLRDAKLYEIGAGTSEIRRMLIGRELHEEAV